MVLGIVLLTTLRDASKRQAEERALDVEEAAKKGSSVENRPSAIPYYPVQLMFEGPRSPKRQPSLAFRSKEGIKWRNSLLSRPVDF